MADTKVQNPTNEPSGGIARRRDYDFGRDFFSLTPFSMMRRLSEEMDRAFSGNFGPSRGFGEPGAWAPAVEVRQRNGDLVILAELPGLDKDDVKVEIADDSITIQGEKKRESESTEGGFHRSERSYGRFYRTIPLPEGTQADKAKAEFKNGVLEVSVPVPQQAQRSKPRQIPIQT
jgi:HSP20 family protein